MKTLYLECNMGAAGDMLTAALLELHPDPQGFVERMNRLGLPGVVFAAQPAVKCGICPASDGARILDLLTRFGLPIDTKYPAETLYSYALSDKKRSGGTVNLIVPRRIGCCAILPTPVEQVQSWIQEGL